MTLLKRTINRTRKARPVMIAAYVNTDLSAISYELRALSCKSGSRVITDLVECLIVDTIW
jgi:hypothetical protein